MQTPQPMHSIPASTARRSGLSGGIRAGGSAAPAEGTTEPPAFRHFSKNPVMSVTRSRITGAFPKGPMRSRPAGATLATWLRQVQRGRPLTVMAQEPHIPTRQA